VRLIGRAPVSMAFLLPCLTPAPPPACRLQESHKSPLNCVTFNHFGAGQEDVFASAGNNRVRRRGLGARVRRGAQTSACPHMRMSFAISWQSSAAQHDRAPCYMGFRLGQCTQGRACRRA
jgi:hypothetical protein